MNGVRDFEDLNAEERAMEVLGWKTPGFGENGNAAAPYRFKSSTNNDFIEKFIAWREKVSDAPSEYAEALAIGVLASVAGSRLRIPIAQSPHPIPCSLYLLLLGGSTVYRKSDSLYNAEALLQDVIPSVVMEAPGSPEGFVQDLARHEAQGATLFSDETAWWFWAMKKKPHLADMKLYLLRAADGSTISRRLRSKKGKDGGDDVDVAKAPALTILGSSTPDRLATVSTREDIEDGFWPRWAIVWPTGRPALRPMGPAPPGAGEQRAEIVELLRTANQRLGVRAQAILTDDAWRAANDAQAILEQRALEDDQNGAIYSRAEIRVFKIAALLALADDINGAGSVIVDKRHVDDAARLVNTWLLSAKRFADTVGLNEFEGAVTRAYEALKRRGGKSTRRDIARVAHVPAKVMDEIERTLEDRGQLFVKDFDVRGAKEWQLRA